MTHLKQTYLIVLILVAFIGCTDIYKPNLDSVNEALVVEGLITDGTGPFTIKLSKAVLFNSDSISPSNYVAGAKLSVGDNQNNSFTLTESGNGNYTLPSTFRAKVGNSYTLHIVTPDGNICESNPQLLLPPQTYDSIRGIYSIQDYLGPNKELEQVAGADIQVDLFKSVSNLNYVPSCRFSSQLTVQYLYSITLPDTIQWYWLYFGWKTVKMETNENITSENLITSNATIKNHSIGFIPYPVTSYGITIPAATFPTTLYYFRMNQYTMNNDSYLFYKGANDQLAATGKLFDPVAAQLYGNMKCINNPLKVVLGLFEVSSVTQQAFFVTKITSNNTVNLKKVPNVDIPWDQSFLYRIWEAFPLPIPKKDSLLYVPVPLPDWWYHE
jgi:hypothetical protein